ncbi:MAG: hypothetical protein KAW89_05735, partial [Armatimonadetes bacterium]|nr:hypothetical protein [Armatimonadota bacterium]
RLTELNNVLALVALQDRVYPYITNVGDGPTRARLAERFERHFTGMQQYLPISALWWYGFAPSQNDFRALEQMERAVASCPEDPSLRYDIGMAWVRVLDTHREVVVSPDLRKRALSAFEKALPGMDGTTVQAPERFLVRIRRGLACTYFYEGQFPAAKREAELVLQVEPNDPLARSIIREVSSR